MKFFKKKISIPLNLQIESYLSPLLRFSLLFSLALIGYGKSLWEVIDMALITSEAQYILAVPPIIIFFLYKKRKALLLLHNNSITSDVTGFCLCFLALMLSIWGLYSMYSLQFTLLSLPIFVVGGFLIFFGFKTLRNMIFPIFLLLFFTPFPSSLVTSLGANLIYFTANASYLILTFLGLPVKLSGGADLVITIFTNDGNALQLALGLPCSGVYSFLGFIFFIVVFTYLASGLWFKKLLFSTLGLLFIYSLNILRVCLLVVVAYLSGTSEVFSFFHSYSGIILLFVGVLLWLFIGEKIFKLYILQKTKDEAQTTLPKIKSNWKRITVLILSLALLVFLINQSSAINYSRVKNDVGFNFDSSTGEVKDIFPNNEDWSYRFLYRDSVAEQRLGLKDVAYYFLSAGKYYENATYAILEISDSQSKFHSWEGCIQFQSIEYKIEKEFYTTIYKDSSSLIIGGTFILNMPSINQSAVLIYWFDALPFDFSGKIEVMNVKLTLIKYVSAPYDINSSNILVDMAFNEATLMGQKIEEFWSTFKVPPQILILDLYNNKEQITILASVILLISLGVKKNSL
jgi:exosortase